MTALDPILLRKYEETHYRVVIEEREYVLRAGRLSQELAKLYRDRGVATASFMTAFNPYSQPSRPDENEVANARLREELKALGLTYLHAIGSDAAGSWQEPSFLILGIPRDQAEALGRAFRQNAIVFADADATPELVLLR